MVVNKEACAPVMRACSMLVGSCSEACNCSCVYQEMQHAHEPMSTTQSVLTNQSSNNQLRHWLNIINSHWLNIINTSSRALAQKLHLQFMYGQATGGGVAAHGSSDVAV